MTESELHPNAPYMFKFLHKAMNELVVGPGDVRDRLVHAGKHFLMIPEEVFPLHLQKDAREIREYLTKWKAIPGAPYPYDSDIRVTMKKRKISTAVPVAERIWTVYILYEEALEARRR